MLNITHYQRNVIFLIYSPASFSSVQFSWSVVSDSLRPQESQHARPPCPSLSPIVCSHECPLSWWCHPTISSSVALISFCPQPFPASGSFPVSRLFSSEWALLRWPKYWSFNFSINPSSEYSGLISFRSDWFDLAVQRTSRVFSSTTVEKHQFFGAHPSVWSSSHIHTWLLEKP